MAANRIISSRPQTTLSSLASRSGKANIVPKGKGSGFYKTHKQQSLQKDEHAEINVWLKKRTREFADQQPEKLHPAALTIWISEKMARKRDDEITKTLNHLKSLLQADVCGVPKDNRLLEKTVKHLEKVKQANAKNNFIKGPLWQMISSKSHQTGSLTLLVFQTGLLCLEKTKDEKIEIDLSIKKGQKVIRQDEGYQEFMDTVCPIRAQEFLEEFYMSGLYASTAIQPEDALPLEEIIKLMKGVVAGVVDEPLNLDNSKKINGKTFLDEGTIEAFTRKTRKGDADHRKLYVKRNESARNFVIAYLKMYTCAGPEELLKYKKTSSEPLNDGKPA